MNTIVIRFNDDFAPSDGTIACHEKMIKQNGFVWFGKSGRKINKEVLEGILKSKSKILLLKSHSNERFWAEIQDYSYSCPDENEIPSYYRDRKRDFNTWLKVSSFKKAEEDILTKCFVKSTGSCLNDIYKTSLSSYFIIKVEE